MSLFKNKYRIESTRWTKWDYSWDAAYFITIVTKHRERFFGQVLDGVMHRSALGQLAHDFWQEISRHFDGVELGAMVIMPDHMHGILTLCRSEYALAQPSSAKAPLREKPNLSGRRAQLSAVSPEAGSIPVIIRSYKAEVTKRGRILCPHFAWQARYHCRVILGETAYDHITRYIIENPERWRPRR